jgi:transposase
MYIREVKKQRSSSSGTFYQYSLVQVSRIERKVKQSVVLYLGSDPLLQDKENRDEVLCILKAKIFGQQDLFSQKASAPIVALALSYYEKYLIRYGLEESSATVSIPPLPAKAEFHNIDIKELQVGDVRSFGAEHLCKQVLDKLQLPECFKGLGMDQEQLTKALISIAAKAIYSVSEHKTAQILEMNSELSACYDHDELITHKQLYAVSDLLYGHKEAIDKFLYSRISDIFGLEDKLVIFDISNTYFESRKGKSKLAKHGRSKEKRTDAPLVVFTGVINAEGFIRHSRIYEGNKADTATLSDMIEDLARYTSPSAKRTIVMDAGIATEDNLKLLKDRNLHYVCVARKRLKDYPLSKEQERVVALTDREHNKVELAIFKPQGFTDTWMYVQSEAKKVKEQSMDTKLKQRFTEELTEIQRALTSKGGTKQIAKVWERIGRAKEKHRRASARYEIVVTQQKEIATHISWSEKNTQTNDDKTNGVYFIRTNYENPNEKELWDIYNTIREVEATFKCLKSDLQIRPVHHQKDSRIEAHLYLTLLAYQLVNTIRHMLKNKGIKYDWSNIKRIMATQTIQTVELPTDKKRIHLRKPSKPIKEVQEIYQATNCTSSQPASKKYVVYH